MELSARTLVVTILVVLITGCALQPHKPERIPLAPFEQLLLWGQNDRVIPLRASLHIRDSQYPHFGYSPDGQRIAEYTDETLLPVDLLIVLGNNQITHVFLARSPHGGCLIRWNGGWPYSQLPDWNGNDLFDEPCYGSRWDIDGRWISGPSPRDMDELPFEIRDGMLWATGEIVYGEEHP